MNTMTDAAAADVLAAHNEWRRYDGFTDEPGSPEAADPRELGLAIDRAVASLRKPASELSSGDKRLIPPVKPPAETQAQGGGEVVLWIAQCELDSLAATPEGKSAFGAVWSRPTGQAGVPLYTAPPSAPVGVEAALEFRRLRYQADRLDSFGMGGAAENIREAAGKLERLAQQPAAEAQAQGGGEVLGYVRRAAIQTLRTDDEVTGVMVHIDPPTNSVPVYLAPPSAPVGVDALAALRIAHKHLDMRSMRVSHCKDAAAIESALAQQPAADDFCNGHCTWRDHAPGCPRHDADQQPESERHG